MNFLFDSGIRLILLVQNFSWLEAPMRFFTFLGSEYFFLFALPVIYWCIDSALGLRIGVSLLFTGGLNDIVKMALRGPRPYWLSAQVRALSAEASFGVPSGHAQNAVVVWGTLANRFGKAWAWIVAGLIIFLIGFSRIFLAVHFPHDVVIGWILGALILWSFIALWDRGAVWVKQKSFIQQMFLALIVSLVMVLLGALAFYGARDYVLPQEWMTNALRAGDPLPAPVSMDATLTSAGVLFGLLVGAAWITRRGGFQPSGPLVMRVLAFVVGLIGILILYLGLKVIFPDGDSLPAYFFRYLRYALIGFWISGGAPWLFFHFKIVRPNP
ncbi:MAG: phosphatase PAP2 family protein [Chloroflexi bacterium]|nr:phosphatase PAP2 family protein [Chloroflexota bacterium]MBI3338701.1 phosphatase PAP2 family protein [Chloroflexota bacterium]